MRFYNVGIYKIFWVRITAMLWRCLRCGRLSSALWGGSGDPAPAFRGGCSQERRTRGGHLLCAKCWGEGSPCSLTKWEQWFPLQRRKLRCGSLQWPAPSQNQDVYTGPDPLQPGPGPSAPLPPFPPTSLLATFLFLVFTLSPFYTHTHTHTQSAHPTFKIKHSFYHYQPTGFIFLLIYRNHILMFSWFNLVHIFNFQVLIFLNKLGAIDD